VERERERKRLKRCTCSSCSKHMLPSDHIRDRKVADTKTRHDTQRHACHMSLQRGNRTGQGKEKKELGPAERASHLTATATLRCSDIARLACRTTP
jgi:hypothetical protein